MIQELWRRYKLGEGGRWINGNPGAQTLARAAFYAGAEAMREAMYGIEEEDLQQQDFARRQGTLTLIDGGKK